MRKLAFAIVAAVGVGIAVPAAAEDVYVGAGPVGVGVDVDNGYHRHYRRDEDAVVVREHGRHCKTTIVHRYGETKKVRRCWD